MTNQPKTQLIKNLCYVKHCHHLSQSWHFRWSVNVKIMYGVLNAVFVMLKTQAEDKPCQCDDLYIRKHCDECAVLFFWY